MRRFFFYCIATLLVTEILLILSSWLFSAMAVGNVESLLTGEGIRWLFGTLPSMLGTPRLIWILLGAMAYGICRSSGILKPSSTDYRSHLAMRISIIFFGIIVVIVILLSAIPHAILLSATGTLFPSPFSRAIIPLTAASIILISSIYGLIEGSFKSIHDILDTLCQGISDWAPVLVFYLMILLVYQSFLFVCKSLFYA